MFSTANWYTHSTGWHENTTKMTSTDPFTLQRFLRDGRDSGCTYAVIEVSSHAIFFHRDYGVEYDAVVLTNISQDHLDLHHTMDAYARTKLRLFEGLVYRHRKPNIKKISCVNVDSPFHELFTAATADVLTTYGLSAQSQVSATDIRLARDTTSFMLTLPSKRIALTTHLRGMFNVYNVLAAVALLSSLAIPMDRIIEGIGGTPSVPGRMEEVENANSYSIFVDYAHTEESLRAVLDTIRGMEGIGRIITVFGATGDRDRTKRPKMGKVVDELSDVVIVTDDDTFSEASGRIIEDILRGIDRAMGDRLWAIPSREDAIRTALLMAQSTDVILIAGKGCETVQVTNAGSIPWQDTQVVRRILREIEENTLKV